MTNDEVAAVGRDRRERRAGLVPQTGRQCVVPAHRAVRGRQCEHGAVDLYGGHGVAGDRHGAAHRFRRRDAPAHRIATGVAQSIRAVTTLALASSSAAAIRSPACTHWRGAGATSFTTGASIVVRRYEASLPLSTE